MLLTTSIVTSKWADYDVDLERIKARVPEHVNNIQSKLLALYCDCLMLISSIDKSGIRKRDRAYYQKIDEGNLKCGEFKSQAELAFKRFDGKLDVLNWIRVRSEDPEPAHQEVRERKEINVPTSAAGNWFLKTEEFSS
ncbi:hypothetical protein QBC36DRAFT_293180 [Triangularia setosa]|uniref:Uncharacterized protein n=1 Tax=Triangularia setosa TaxID=2587417 RepID=A0AAN6W1Y1_9PEZI|nr:hypothetical protein QBC36DRAFT_293180 [Podospora setosa]